MLVLVRDLVGFGCLLVCKQARAASAASGIAVYSHIVSTYISYFAVMSEHDVAITHAGEHRLQRLPTGLATTFPDQHLFKHLYEHV